MVSPSNGNELESVSQRATLLEELAVMISSLDSSHPIRGHVAPGTWTVETIDRGT